MNLVIKLIGTFLPLLSGAVATSFDGNLSNDEKSALLADHNEYRSATALGETGSQPMAKNMIKLEWDDVLAEQAKTWADACIFQHSQSGGSYGENLAVGAKMSFQHTFSDLQGGISGWWKEHEDYNFDENSCASKMICGHYTQVVWAETTKVGCGYKPCGAGFIIPNWPYQYNLVCQYSSPGNFIGEFPYVKANDDKEVASECPQDYTSEKETGLCVKIEATCSDTTFLFSGKKDCKSFIDDKTGDKLVKKCEKWDKFGRLVKNHCPDSCLYSCAERCANDEAFEITRTDANNEEVKHNCDTIPNKDVNCNTIFKKKKLVGEYCRASCGICG